MKEYHTGGERRLWYEPAEIEAIAVDELSRAGLLPRSDEDDVSVDIEALVERHLKLPLDQYAQLEPDVLGVTTFVPGQPPRISLNRDLTGSALDAEEAAPGLLGRWRATLAHEAAHVLLHRILYELDDLQRGLFTAGPRTAASPKLHRCLKRDVGLPGSGRDWKEIQANMGMGALLMPRPLVLAVVKEERQGLGIADQTLVAGSHAHAALTGSLSRRFKVSKEVAGIRLDTLAIAKARAQRTL